MQYGNMVISQQLAIYYFQIQIKNKQTTNYSDFDQLASMLSSSSTIPMDSNISKKKFAYIQKNNTTTITNTNKNASGKQKQKQKQRQFQGQENYFFSQQWQSHKNQSKCQQNSSNFKIRNQKQRQRSMALMALISSQNNQNQISEKNININKNLQKQRRNNQNCGLFLNSSHISHMSDISDIQGDYGNGQEKNQYKNQLKDLYIIIEQLSRQLQKQRNKFKQFQEKTIKDQMNVLNSLNFLQQKLKKLSQEKKDLIKEVQLLKQEKQKQKQKERMKFNIIEFESSQKTKQKQGIKNTDINQILNKLTFQLCQNCLSQSKVSLQQIYYLFHNKQKELKQFKKIKGISKSLIDMMYKVEGVQKQKCQAAIYEKQKYNNSVEFVNVNAKVNVRQLKILKSTQKSNNQAFQKENIQNQNFELKAAWKWIKKIVHEYQMIKNKAFKWKKVYDEVIKGDDSSNDSHQELFQSSQSQERKYKNKENIRNIKQNQIYFSKKLRSKQKLRSKSKLGSKQKQKSKSKFDSFMNIHSSENQS